ncbi:calcium-binding protein [Nostoc sphaeroides]|uniref:Calcium-binding protein n=1 Tax=Nostoc sphaeroides CCNUC1 TaxID=2653204 RepID=A0A5P8W085_9NOSO|nr:calcium-binding protein [Nostoc sphaeroides]QFS45449.1 calcium-binding protein [Nostoc sphaeroides CCNUC1]
MATINGTNRPDNLSGVVDSFFNFPNILNADIINGFDGNDTIKGGSNNDTINGGNNDDLIDGGDGNDSLIGGAGNDTIDGGFGGFRLNNNNNTINGGLGNDSLIGAAGNDTINGEKGNDTIDGRDGDDLIDGGDGDDLIDGGDGNDSLIGGAGNDTIDGGFGGFRLNNNNNTVNGGLGNDSLIGAAGNDTINGGTGNDRLIGDTGTDLLTGGLGNDVFKFNSVSESQPGVLRDAIADFVGNGNSPGDQIDLSTFEGNQAFTFIGASAFSAPGQVRYSGGILQANIDRNLSADFEIQLVGAPQLVVSDIIFSATDDNSDSDNNSSSIMPSGTSDGRSPTGSFSSSGASDKNGSIFTSSFDNNINYIIKSGSGNDTINAGGTGNDTIDGGSGNDTINGGRGNDILTGGTGTDRLTGGAGNDVFKFNSVLESQPGVLRDAIADFVGNGNLPGDRIDLSTIDANSNIGGNQAFTYIGSSAFFAVGQVRYSGGILQGNTAGNLSPEFEVQLTGTPQLVASDIIV